MASHTVSVLPVTAALTGAALQFTAPAWGKAVISCSAPLETDGEWQTGPPEDVDLDPVLLCSLNEVLDKSPEMNGHAVVILQGSKLI
jgi:hypothetical protein